LIYNESKISRYFEGENDMNNKNIKTPAELDLYCGLLEYAYKIYQEKTGLVCGVECEALRDKMFLAIKEIIQ
jgi:hypothetical protein